MTETSARIAWSEPREPNGVITGYRVAYRLRSSLQWAMSDDSVSAARRRYRVTGLSSYRYYEFIVAAKTQSGWGAEESLLVYTVSDRSEFVCLPTSVLTAFPDEPGSAGSPRFSAFILEKNIWRYLAKAFVWAACSSVTEPILSRH